MAIVKALAQGFLITTTLIACSITLLFSLDSWVASMVLLISAVLSTTLTIYCLRRNRKNQPEASTEKLRNTLFSMQGVALACWMFDLATTYYAVDVKQVAVEINPLGWPLGILGALAYYGPTLLLSYVLLFRMKEKISLYAAVPMTVVAVYMGLMNLNAGTLNLQIVVYT